MTARTWRWLAVRIYGLLNAPTPTRLQAALTSKEAPRVA